jgi:hypothetical protein
MSSPTGSVLVKNTCNVVEPEGMGWRKKPPAGRGEAGITLLTGPAEMSAAASLSGADLQRNPRKPLLQD